MNEKEFSRNKVGLVLEGGGFRCCYTAGALTWLIDNSVEIPYVSATSAGAICGILYLLKKKDELHDFSINAVKDRYASGLHPLLHEHAIIGYEYLLEKYSDLYSLMILELQKDMNKDIHLPLYNMTSGKIDYFDKMKLDTQGKVLRASCTLPISGKMVRIGESYYLDGGIEQMIPLEKSLTTGHDYNLVILTKDLKYVREPMSNIKLKTLSAKFGQYPEFLEAMKTRHINYYQQMDCVGNEVRNNKALIIRPSADCGVKRFSGSREELEHLFQLGYEDMENRKNVVFKLMGRK